MRIFLRASSSLRAPSRTCASTCFNCWSFISGITLQGTLAAIVSPSLSGHFTGAAEKEDHRRVRPLKAQSVADLQVVLLRHTPGQFQHKERRHRTTVGRAFIGGFPTGRGIGGNLHDAAIPVHPNDIKRDFALKHPIGTLLLDGVDEEHPFIVSKAGTKHHALRLPFRSELGFRLDAGTIREINPLVSGRQAAAAAPEQESENEGANRQGYLS